MHQLFAGPEAADELVIELDAAEGRATGAACRAGGAGGAAPPRELVVADLEFGRDLLALRMDAEGKPKPESPSSLETLMVSGLAWLLQRLEAEPLDWAPESRESALLGTLAHEVFEGLFQAGRGAAGAGGDSGDGWRRWSRRC